MTTDFFALMAIVAFWSWIVTFLIFIFKVFPRTGVFQNRLAVIWGGASVLCACLWLFALRNA